MKDAIKKAIGAHGMWKARLKGAIDHGKIEIPVATIRVDNQCEFGKWLYGATIPANVKASEHYKKVKELHAHFHSVAAIVADHALSGQRADAEKMLTAEFDPASIKLSKEMLEWQKELG
jgi:hypothetical protein